AEAVLRVLLRRAIYCVSQGDPPWFASGTPMEQILYGNRLSLKEHLELDDTDVLFSIKRWQNSGDPVLSDLAKRFLNRRLFKAFDLDMPEAERPRFIDASRKIVKAAGFDPDYYFIEDDAGNLP